MNLQQDFKMVKLVVVIIKLLLWETIGKQILAKTKCIQFAQKVKLVTIVKGNLKAPFSIATTPMCRERHNSFPRIAPLYPWYIPYSAEY